MSAVDFAPSARALSTTGVSRGKILIDHTHCGRHVTGIERISLELFSAEALSPLPVEIIRSSGVRDMIVKQTVSLPSRLARDKRAILLCPGFPPSPLATVFGARVLPYIHDVFLITRWQDLNPRAKIYMSAPFRLALKKLPRFLVNSRTTRDEVRRFCRPDAEISLYRPAVRNVFGLGVGDRKERASKPGAFRLVALGTVEPRKNLQAAADILMALRARHFPDATLDIVGRFGWGKDAERLQATPGVTLHGYQEMATVRSIVESADALIATSHDEGLGLPLLEAQYAGLPVIASDIAVFREVLDGCGLLIDTAALAASADRIAAMATADGWRAQQAQAAIANLDRWMAGANDDRNKVIDLIGRIAARDGLAAC